MGSTPPRRSIAWSVAILVAAALAATVAWRWTAPMQLDFEMACEHVPAMGTLTFDLNQGSTELTGVTTEDFHAAATDVAAATFASPANAKPVPLSKRTFTLVPSPGPNNAHLELARSGDINTLSVTVSGRAVVSATVGVPSAPTFTVESLDENDTTLSVVSHVIRIQEANRYTVAEVDPKTENPDFAATLTGGGLVRLTLSSRARAMTVATVLLRGSPDARLPLVSREQPLKSDSTLTCTGALNPTLHLDQKRVDGIQADQPVAVVARYTAGTLKRLELLNDPARRGQPALFLTGTATANSLSIDGRELITNWLEEIVSKPFSTRTRWFLFLGALAAIGIKIVDHALGVLLEFWIPKGQ